MNPSPAVTANAATSSPAASTGSQPRLNYQVQDSPMTLREGLDEYYAKNSNVTRPDQASAVGATFFARHDVTHVVFGTSTQLEDEILNDLWQMFGLDISAWEYVKQGLAPEEVRDIVYDIGFWGMAKSLALTPVYLVKVWRRARHMHKPWPWIDFEAYLDMPLAELRREFGVQVIA